MLNHMVHIASRLSKEMSQNVDDIRIKQPIPEAAIDITANLSNGTIQKRKRQRMSPATLTICKACLQQHSLWKSCCLLRPKSRNHRFSCRKAASPCKRGWSCQICKAPERLHLLAFETTMKLVKSYACALPLALEGVHGVGAKPAATQAAIHVPSAALHARIAAGTPAPAVTVPKVAPAAA